MLGSDELDGCFRIAATVTAIAGLSQNRCNFAQYIGFIIHYQNQRLLRLVPCNTPFSSCFNVLPGGWVRNIRRRSPLWGFTVGGSYYCNLSLSHFFVKMGAEAQQSLSRTTQSEQPC